MEKLIELIRKHQEGHEAAFDDVFTVGEQLLDMASRQPECIEILIQDLNTPKMGLCEAAAQIKKYADEHRKSAKCYCVSPMIAEGILREFYGLPKPDEKSALSVESAPAAEDYIDLGDFF